MNNKILFGIVLVAATLAIGALSNGEIVEAAKPATEVVTNTDPISVTGIVTSSSQLPAVSGKVTGNFVGCVGTPIFLHIKTNWQVPGGNHT